MGGGRRQEPTAARGSEPGPIPSRCPPAPSTAPAPSPLPGPAGLGLGENRRGVTAYLSRGQCPPSQFGPAFRPESSPQAADPTSGPSYLAHPLVSPLCPPNSQGRSAHCLFLRRPANFPASGASTLGLRSSVSSRHAHSPTGLRLNHSTVPSGRPARVQQLPSFPPVRLYWVKACVTIICAVSQMCFSLSSASLPPKSQFPEGRDHVRLVFRLVSAQTARVRHWLPRQRLGLALRPDPSRR